MLLDPEGEAAPLVRLGVLWSARSVRRIRISQSRLLIFALSERARTGLQVQW